MRAIRILSSVTIAVLMMDCSAKASVASKVIKEAIEVTAKKFGREAAEEGLERLAGKMTRLAATHGDDVVATAFKNVGPRAAKVAAEAGDHGGLALRLLARHGDEALSIATKPGALSTVAKYGDDAAGALLKHGAVGETVISGFGKEGVEALGRVTTQNGRRLAMLAADGTLKPELMTVIARHGDIACDFVWRNKAALAVGTGLATFIAAPEEFLNGTQQLASVVADAAIKPLATIPGAVASEAAKHVHWNLFLFTGLVVIGGIAGLWMNPMGLTTQLVLWIKSHLSGKGAHHHE